MTGTDLRDLILSPDFKQDLEEMSSYLASIKQERPIVYLLAKSLWKRGHKFDLEDKKTDLSINGKRIEFKFSYDTCQVALTTELVKYGDNLRGMWEDVQAKKINK